MGQCPYVLKALGKSVTVTVPEKKKVVKYSLQWWPNTLTPVSYGYLAVSKVLVRSLKEHMNGNNSSVFFNVIILTSSPAKEGSRWVAPLQRYGWEGQGLENYCCTDTHWATPLKHHWTQQTNSLWGQWLSRFPFHMPCRITFLEYRQDLLNWFCSCLPCIDQALLHSPSHFPHCISDFISWRVGKTDIQETSAKQACGLL